MAQVLGESGRYVSQEAVRKRRNIVILALSVTGTLCFVWGISIGLTLHAFKIPAWTSLFILIAMVIILLGVAKWSLPKLDELEKERVNMQRGANGEDLVAQALVGFPEEFTVINDLTTPFGNLDHVVVGPTGVFLLDTKNWRGVVSAGNQGELLCNGMPTDKPFVRQFVGRIMGIKERVKALTPGLDPYFQAVFVFTSARVDANWGTTKSVHCIRDEQLREYVVESKRGNKLTQEQVETTAQAFLGLAHMDKDFTAKAEQNKRPRVPAIVNRPYERTNASLVPLKPSLNRTRN
jgi:hypothetical protein